MTAEARQTPPRARSSSPRSGESRERLSGRRGRVDRLGPKAQTVAATPRREKWPPPSEGPARAPVNGRAGNRGRHRTRLTSRTWRVTQASGNPGGLWPFLSSHEPEPRSAVPLAACQPAQARMRPRSESAGGGGSFLRLPSGDTLLVCDNRRSSRGEPSPLTRVEPDDVNA